MRQKDDEKGRGLGRVDVVSAAASDYFRVQPPREC